MANERIQNPKTSRQIQVRTWTVRPKEVYDFLREDSRRTAKELSWKLLSEPHSLCAMERTQRGDSARNNFALNVLENALDWSLGIAILNFLRDYRAQRPGRQPKEIKVAASRSGDVFILIQSASRGQVVLPY